MSSDVDLRPEDFRKAWPTALVIALREASDLLNKVETIKESIDTSNESAIAVAEKLPEIVKAVKLKIDEINVGAIELQKQQFEILNSIIKSQTTVDDAINSLAVGLNRLDKNIVMLSGVVAELVEENKAARDKKSFFSRLFK